MYCEHCGTKIPDGSIFCIACGKRQSGGVAAEEPRKDVTPPPEPKVSAPQAEPEASVPQAEPEVSAPQVEASEPQAEPEMSAPKDDFDWSTFNPVPDEPVEEAKTEPDPAPWQPQDSWQAAAPQQGPQNTWQSNQSGWQGSAQQGTPGWQQNGWQGNAQQNGPGWQQSGWQGNAQQSAPGWQQGGWQGNAQQGAPGWQQNGWQGGPQQGYQGGWQSAPPQQGAYHSPYDEQRQPVYQNGRIDYGRPMNWYKFQIYFRMIPMAFTYMILGVALLLAGGISSSSMSGSLEYYYYGFGAMSSDARNMLLLYLPFFVQSMLIVGLISAVYGILMLVAWVKMIRLRSGGWVLFLVVDSLPTIFMGINLLITVFRMSNYVPSSYLMEMMTIPLVSLAVGVLVIILQIVYFKKRAYLFINR